MCSGKLSLDLIDPHGMKGIWIINPTTALSPPPEGKGIRLRNSHSRQSLVSPRAGGLAGGVGGSHSVKVSSPGAAISHEWMSPRKGDMGRAPIPSTELLTSRNKVAPTTKL